MLTLRAFPVQTLARVLLPDEIVVDAAGGASLKRKMAAETHGSILLTK